MDDARGLGSEPGNKHAEFAALANRANTWSHVMIDLGTYVPMNNSIRVLESHSILFTACHLDSEQVRAITLAAGELDGNILCQWSRWDLLLLVLLALFVFKRKLFLS